MSVQISPCPLQHVLLLVFLIKDILGVMKWHYSFDWHFPSGQWCCAFIFMCLFVTIIPSFRNVYSKTLGCLFFSRSSLKSSLYLGCKSLFTSMTCKYFLPMAENVEELKSLLMRVKEKSERASLKLNIKKKKKDFGHPAPILHGKEKGEEVAVFPLLGSKITGLWLQPWNKTIASWQESYAKPRQCIEKQRHYSADKGPYIQGYGFPSCMVVRIGP